ncbi:hypothetical protein HAX54_022667, partial [Datura stramonium]|nr:hypothetical protein [Datura stramonium]
TMTAYKKDDQQKLRTQESGTVLVTVIREDTVDEGGLEQLIFSISASEIGTHRSTRLGASTETTST